MCSPISCICPIFFYDPNPPITSDLTHIQKKIKKETKKAVQ